MKRGFRIFSAGPIKLIYLICSLIIVSNEAPGHSISLSQDNSKNNHKSNWGLDAMDYYSHPVAAET
ncbi:MAG TPA: hypothetical protein PLS62_11650, partial [Desulfobacteraceae bacterium]|nr:hypothetical protein [Desulfobacteraceae bacterium]